MATKLIAVTKTNYDFNGKTYVGATFHLLDTERNKVNSYFVQDENMKSLGLTKAMMPQDIENLPDLKAFKEEGYKGKLRLAKLELVA